MKRRPHRVPVRRLLAVALVTVAGLASAPSARAALQEPLDALRADLASIVSGTGWDAADWSVLVVSLEHGDTLWAHQPRRPLAPASNMKLVTTAAALEHLGPAYRYRTFVLSDAPLESGVLRGDLVLYGTGDPGLSDRFHPSRTAAFDSLAADLRAAGVRRVAGDVVGDESFFAGPLLAEGWDPRDLNDWFAAPASALSFNENVVTLRVSPGASAGAPPRVRTLPEGADLPLDLTATTGRGRLQIERDAPTDPVRIEGGIPRGGREVWRRLTVGDPARYAAQIFRNVLEEHGIEVAGGVRTVSDPAASLLGPQRLHAPAVQGRATPRILATHVSSPLSDYLEVVNKESHNLLAELTMKTLGRLVEGDGSYVGGSHVLERFLASAGVDTAAVVIHDGSGLSGQNRLSARAFVRLLDHMDQSPQWEAYWATLPEAGNPRELRRMYETSAAGNLRAKTGTIENVSALSGVVRTANGERVAFSIIGNALPSTWGAKRVEDRIGSRLAAFDRPAPRTRMADAGPDASGAAAGEAAGAAERAAAAGDAGGGTSRTAAAAADEPESDTEAAAATAEPRRHRVLRGENFTSIARRYGVSLDALMQANPDVQPRRLQAGQWLDVPTGR